MTARIYAGESVTRFYNGVNMVHEKQNAGGARHDRKIRLRNVAHGGGVVATGELFMRKRLRIAGLGALAGLMLLAAALSMTAGCIRCEQSIRVKSTRPPQLRASM